MTNCEVQPNFMNGIILNYKDRKELEQWFKDIYDMHCLKQKGSPYNVISYNYHTGEITISGGYRKELTAMEPFCMARGFIALFYKGEIISIERRELI